MIVCGSGRRPGIAQQLFEHEAGGRVKQLTRRLLRAALAIIAARACNWNRANGPSVIVRTAVEPPVDHHTAANERADKQIEKVVDAAPLAHHQFGGAGCSGVLGEFDGQAGHGSDMRADVDVVPRIERVRRRAQKITPATEP